MEIVKEYKKRLWQSYSESNSMKSSVIGMGVQLVIINHEKMIELRTHAE